MPEVIAGFAVSTTAVVAAIVAAAAVMVLRRLAGRLVRGSELLTELVQRTYRPTQMLLILVAVRVSLAAADGETWPEPVLHGLLLAAIAAGAWMLIALLHVLEDGVLSRISVQEVDPHEVRRRTTQVKVVRRTTAAGVAVLAVGAMLVTFPQARTAGASLLASAGVASVIAALAAQSMLRNVLAGLQLTFGNVMNLGDVVVVEGEWGRVEEITLGYVVVRIWDKRRLILPTSYVTTTPFVNWTKSDPAVYGIVELDVDRSLPLDPMRDELQRCVKESPLWDGEWCTLQLTEATGAFMRVRATVSAANGAALWDLQCLVREALVRWVGDRYPGAHPKIRTEPASAGTGLHVEHESSESRPPT